MSEEKNGIPWRDLGLITLNFLFGAVPVSLALGVILALLLYHMPRSVFFPLGTGILVLTGFAATYLCVMYKAKNGDAEKSWRSLANVRFAGNLFGIMCAAIAAFIEYSH